MKDPFAVADKYLDAAMPEDREEAKRLAAGLEAAPPCDLCGAQMTEVVDIFGVKWWGCWACAKTV